MQRLISIQGWLTTETTRLLMCSEEPQAVLFELAIPQQNITRVWLPLHFELPSSCPYCLQYELDVASDDGIFWHVTRIHRCWQRGSLSTEHPCFEDAFPSTVTDTATYFRWLRVFHAEVLRNDPDLLSYLATDDAITSDLFLWLYQHGKLPDNPVLWLEFGRRLIHPEGSFATTFFSPLLPLPNDVALHTHFGSESGALIQKMNHLVNRRLGNLPYGQALPPLHMLEPSQVAFAERFVERPLVTIFSEWTLDSAIRRLPAECNKYDQSPKLVACSTWALATYVSRLWPRLRVVLVTSPECRSFDDGLLLVIDCDRIPARTVHDYPWYQKTSYAVVWYTVLYRAVHSELAPNWPSNGGVTLAQLLRTGTFASRIRPPLLPETSIHMQRMLYEGDLLPLPKKTIRTVQQLVNTIVPRRNNKQKKQRDEHTVVFARTQADAQTISRKAKLPTHGESWFAVGDIVQDWRSGRFARIDSLFHGETRLMTNARYDFRSYANLHVALTWMDSPDEDGAEFVFHHNSCEQVWLQHSTIHLVEQYTGGPGATVIALLIGDVDAPLTQCEVDFLLRLCTFLTADGVLIVGVLPRNL